MLFSLVVRLRFHSRALLLALTVVTLAACTSSTSPAPPPPPGTALNNALLQDLTSYLTTRSAIEHISTLSMAISFRGDPSLIDMAVGTTKYGGGGLVTTTSLFQTGSNTKAFTSAIILELEAAGSLSISDTVGTWLPQYPAWGNVTLQQLLNMTSGIPTYDSTSAWETDYSNNPYTQWTPAQLVAYVYPNRNPAPSWSYSNTGYILAQMIIDKASPLHSYQAELNKLIATQGLQDTFYEPYFYPTSIQSRVVAGYDVNTDDLGLSKLFNQDTSRFSLGWAQSAGGMVSTPADLTLWVRALFEGNVLPAKQHAELTSLVAIPSGVPIDGTSSENPQGFALGLFEITDPPRGVFWGYQGSTIGYRAAYAYFPTSGLIICVFTNSQAPTAVSTVNTVLFNTLYDTLHSFGKV
jgi:D-alanyl-D-alanine carboxypeptidase